MAEGGYPGPEAFRRIRRRLLGPEASYFKLAIFFSAVVSLLILAVPISIQMLIDQVANTALVQPVIVLALTLFGLLLLAGFFYSLREYVLELFERRFYARMSGEITLKVLNAPAPYFDKARRDDLLNRYFDIMTVKKSLPYIMVGLFAFFFQGAIGFTVTSLYHPAFLLFNVVLILLLYAVWKLWAWPATESAFHVSDAKYDTAAFIESLSHQADLFKAGPHSEVALKEANHLIETHVGAMKNIFRLTFAQLISLLFLYALASASLLGIGGYLVIVGELTLGQLVAAELILSAIFAGFGPLAGYWKEYYSLSAALEELDRITAIPDGTQKSDVPIPPGGGGLILSETEVSEGGFKASLDFTLEPGSCARVLIDDPNARRSLKRLLKGHITEWRGTVRIDGVDLRDWPDPVLHEEVVVIDRPRVPQNSVQAILRLADPSAGYAELESALDAVGLLKRVQSLPDGFDTVVSPSGWPFEGSELLRLKLATAILDKPRLLLLSSIFDPVDAQHIEGGIKALQAIRKGLPAPTIILLSDRTDIASCTDVKPAADSRVDAPQGGN